MAKIPSVNNFFIQGTNPIDVKTEIADDYEEFVNEGKQHLS